MRDKFLFQDFARNVFVKNIIIAGAGSSWAVWSAIAANTGNVYIGEQKGNSVEKLRKVFSSYSNIHVIEAKGMWPSNPACKNEVQAGRAIKGKKFDVLLDLNFTKEMRNFLLDVES